MFRSTALPYTWLWITALAALLGTTAPADEPPALRWWLSTVDLEHQLTEQEPLPLEPAPDAPPHASGTIRVDDRQSYQTILGLGSSLEHTTCYNLSQLAPEDRDEAIERLFHPTRGIGIDLTRICIGTPDFTGDPWYSYNDLPPGATDPQLENFSIDNDRRYVLPILKQALATNPQLLFFASPWSPPGWMTSTDDMIGGYLLPEHYDAYARYFVRFIQAYQQEGIPIHAVTVQNEPGVDRSQDEPRWHYPSCRFTAEQERDFIKSHLGPAFERAGLPTEIWTYDHNFNVAPTADGDDPGIDYPRTVLSDPDAARYVSGVAFHGYAGDPSGMSQLHTEFPQVPIHFTEGSVFGPPGGLKLIEYLRNHASSYNGWVTMIDTQGKPNNGPFRASRTCVTLNHRTGRVDYHYDFFQYGHFFRFIQRGARRIASTGGDKTLNSVAFINPDASLVLVVVNPGRDPRELAIDWRGARATTTLPGRSVASFTRPSD